MWPILTTDIIKIKIDSYPYVDGRLLLNEIKIEAFFLGFFLSGYETENGQIWFHSFDSDCATEDI